MLYEEIVETEQKFWLVCVEFVVPQILITIIATKLSVVQITLAISDSVSNQACHPGHGFGHILGV